MTKRKIIIGLGLGSVAGIVDVIPMIFQKLTWDANLSAFCMWVIAGLLISTSNLKLPGILKGVLISFLLLTPTAVLIGAKEPFSLVPISIMTLILGSLLGFSTKKIGDK